MENHPVYAPLLEPIFLALGGRGGLGGALGDHPPCDPGPAQKGGNPLVPVDLAVAKLTTRLRAKYGPRTPDALQVASAIHAGATRFLTDDAQLKQTKEPEVLLSLTEKY
ncbi:MAG: type II toxin-antitoxin system VapC family toxin [Candidatus Bipolaricaulaceae bacterium]